jgi:hypothetical protein
MTDLESLPALNPSFKLGYIKKHWDAERVVDAQTKIEDIVRSSLLQERL